MAVLDVHAKLVELAPSLTVVYPDEVNFGVVAKNWLEEAKPHLKTSSLVKYTNILTSHIFPYFEHTAVTAITKEDVVAFRNDLLASEAQQGKGLAPRTVASILAVLKSIFTYAKQNEGCTVPHLDNISIKQAQMPLRVLSVAEQKKMNGYLLAHLTPINLGILVCLYTGLRIGEICALKWEDISLKEGYISVHKTMQRLQTGGGAGKKTSVLVSTPKSGCSIRRIPMPGEIFQLVSAARQPGSAYVLTGFSDRFVEPRTLQNHFKAVAEACDIENVHFHSLRHTFATRCVELGFDAKSLSEILGHANVSITMNRYVHPSMAMKQQNMDKLSSLFIAN